MPLQTSAAKLGPIIESTEFYNFLLNTEPKRIPLPSLYKRDVVNLQRETFILMTEAPGFLQGTRILTVGFDRIFYPAIRDNSISARKSVIFVVKEGPTVYDHEGSFVIIPFFLPRAIKNLPIF